MARESRLVILARDNPLYEAIRERLIDAAVVILDRRQGERRSRSIGVGLDRRRGERRQPLAAEADQLWREAGYLIVTVDPRVHDESVAERSVEDPDHRA